MARNRSGGVDLLLSSLGVSVWSQCCIGLCLHGLLKKVAYIIVIHYGGNDISMISLWEVRTLLQEVFSGLVTASTENAHYLVANRSPQNLALLC